MSLFGIIITQINNMNLVALGGLLVLLIVPHLVITLAVDEVEMSTAASGGEFRPMEEAITVTGQWAAGGRRRLEPYQLCLVCKCCAAGSSSCATMPCCFGIDCQLPNKPYGVCAFVPKSCNCNSCAV